MVSTVEGVAHLGAIGALRVRLAGRCQRVTAYAASMAGIRMVRRGFAHDGTGPLPYRQMWEEQREVHQRVVAGEDPGTILLLEHQPVYTAGRRTEPGDRPLPGVAEALGAEVVDVDRGGRITWHGPGQLVAYPILALPDAIFVVDYVRRLEQALIDVCVELGLPAVPVGGRSGVWLPADPATGRPERKVAAIGVRVSHGVTMHGIALNVAPDLDWFNRIVPCGIPDAGVTSLTQELGRAVRMEEVLPLVESHLHAAFDAWAAPAAPRQATPVASPRLEVS